MDLFLLIKDFLIIVGGILGAVTFVWKVRDTSSSYIHIDLNVGKPAQGYSLIKSTVENKGFSKKKIENALLLIGPENESVSLTYHALRTCLKR